MHTPSLFGEQPAVPPTTRDVARQVKRLGVAGLPDAQLRADAARYQEVTCRSALNRVQGMPFQWTLNPYRGCTHGCHYCFARRYQTQLELGSGDDFASVILVKVNFPAVLRRELARATARARPDPTTESVALGTATDPYQPIEGHYRLTRQTLETLLEHPMPLGLITKGPMVLRDADLLVELSRRTRCTVTMSVPTVDDDAWRRLEPGTAPPTQRLRVVQQLADAGVDAGVLMAPIVPGISSHPAKIEKTIRAIAAHGARYVGGLTMHLEGGTREHFLRFLGREFPHLVSRYGRLYAGKHPTRDYRARVRSVLDTLTARYGLGAQPQTLKRETGRA